ncbi:cytochrome c peroxidase [soil metagenome]
MDAGNDSASTRRMRYAVRVARSRYKRVEGVVEFYAPALAAALNARRLELDDDDLPPPSSTAPTGFPALEGLSGRPYSRANADSARRIVHDMRARAARLRILARALVVTEAQVIELTRLELARIGTLGIAGFDAPKSGEAIREGAEAIEGLRETMAQVAPAFWPALVSERSAVDSTLALAADYMRAHGDFEYFNRLAYIAAYGDPAFRAIDALRRTANVVPVRIQRAWRADVASPYAVGAFDVNAYAPSGTPPSDLRIVELGRRLFLESALSGTETRSCASCHQPTRAFTDGRRVPESMVRHAATPMRNTPTLLHAALQPAQFADERSVTLEDQVIAVLASPAEMGSSLERAVVAIRRRPYYDSAFTSVFGTASPELTGVRLRHALAQYVRSLVRLDSRFDRAVRGDTSVMSEEERRGFTLFMGKAACGTCHFAPLFNGSVPPRYLSSDVEVIGTPASPMRPWMPDADSGRARIDHMPLHYRAFKTPGLRDVARTSPYMHNGAFRTLDDVILFYDAGGGVGAGAKLDNQTLSADSLHLSAADRRAIIAFLGTLSTR